MTFNLVESGVLQWISAAVALLFLTIGSISDYRTREVSDKIWVLFAPVGGTVTGLWLTENPSAWLLVLASAASATVIALTVYYAGLYGGADAKALICIAITMPLVPSNFEPPLGHFHVLFPLSVLYNAYLLALFPAGALIFYNGYQFARRRGRLFKGLEHEPLTRKAVALLTGYPASLNEITRSVHLYPLEVPTGDPHRPRRLKLFVSADTDRDETIARLRASIANDSNPEVWATPGLPLLIFVALSFLVVFLVGDVLMWLVFSLLRAL